MVPPRAEPTDDSNGKEFRTAGMKNRNKELATGGHIEGRDAYTTGIAPDHTITAEHGDSAKIRPAQRLGPIKR